MKVGSSLPEFRIFRAYVGLCLISLFVSCRACLCTVDDFSVFTPKKKLSTTKLVHHPSPQGVHDGSMGQRNDFSPLDVLQLRDMHLGLGECLRKC